MGRKFDLTYVQRSKYKAAFNIRYKNKCRKLAEWKENSGRENDGDKHLFMKDWLKSVCRSRKIGEKLGTSIGI